MPSATRVGRDRDRAQAIRDAADAPTIALDLALSDWHRVTLPADRTLSLAGGYAGQQFAVIVVQGAGGGHAVAWWAGIEWMTADGSAPAPGAADGAVTVYTFKENGGGTYLGFLAGPAGATGGGGGGDGAPGALLIANNLGDLADAAAARGNLGLGGADAPTFAGITLADFVIHVGDLVKVTTGGALMAADAGVDYQAPYAPAPANRVLATAAAGAVSQVPMVRALVPADIPALPESQITGLVADLAARAPLASPDFTGTPTVPTAAPGTNTAQAASTAFVTTAVGNAVIAAGGGQPADNDLTALAALGGTGFAARTAADTWALRSIAVGSGKLSLSNPAGIAGNPTLDVVEASLTLNNLGGTLGAGKGGTGLDGSGAANGQLMIGTGAGFALGSLGVGSGLTRAQGSGTLSVAVDFGIVAPLASPALTGVPTAPTAAGGTASTQVATTAFVANALAALINAAPAALDTLGEIAAQLASDESAVGALTTTVAGKLAKSANLSDLVDAATARTNLGLGTAATHADTDYLHAASNLSDVANPATARTNLGLGIGVNVQGYSAELAGVATLAAAGIVARTGSGTYAARTLAVGSNKLTLANPAGTAGNPTFDVAEANLTLGNMGGSVATAQINDGAVTYAKIQNVTSGRLLGRSTAGSGVVEEIAIGSGLSLSGGTLAATGGGGGGSPGGSTGQVQYNGAGGVFAGDAGLTYDGSGNVTATGVVKGGNFASAVATKATNYTLTAADGLIVGDCGSGAITLTLPTAVGATGRRHTIKRQDSALNNSNALTVATTSAQTIDGQATTTLDLHGDWITFASDGSNWVVVERGPGVRTRFRQTQEVTVTGTAETSLIGTGVGAASFLSNFFTPGRTGKVKLSGLLTSAASAGNITVRFKLGGTTVCATATVGITNSQSGKGWSAEFDVVGLALAVSGSVRAQGIFTFYQTSLTIQNPIGATSSGPTTIDTTGALAVDVTVQFSATGNTLTCSNVVIQSGN